MTPSRYAGLGVAALAVLLFPVTLSASTLIILTTTGCIAVAALGLDVLVGRTGQLSLAHAAFLGVGAYAAIGASSRGAPWPLALLVAVVLTSFAAAVAGLPSLRIRGLQIAITTLVFQLFAERFLFALDVVTEDRAFVRPSMFEGELPIYYLVVAVVAAVAYGTRRLADTKAGRSFVAVRDAEPRAVTFGIEPGPTKLLAYALSGGVVGLAGGLFALQQGTFRQIDDFNLQSSLVLVAIVVVGGARSPAGIVIASMLFRAVPSLVQVDAIAKWLPATFALLLVVSVVAQPEGIGGVLRQAGDAIDARLRGRPERPLPRPLPTDPVASARAAAHLRDVPRALRDRMPVPALLVAEHATVRYGGVLALDDVSLEVRRGEIVGLIGANGAGKSTFFNAVSGLAPVTGSIRYRDRELVGSVPSRRTSAGVARTFQDMGLLRADTVRENLLLSQTWLASYPAAGGIVGLFGAVPTERELRRRADLALELFGLTHLAGELLGGLPYGTMRTVEIAAAVAAGPDLLLLDEASAGLTPEEAHGLADRFLALRSELGLTLVVIEHHVPLIARVCDWCYCLESGAVIAAGTPAEVTAQPRVVESFLGRGVLA